MLKRKDNWLTQHYIPFVVENEHAQFAWGTWDCALFAANGIRSITDIDIASDFRGTYTDEQSSIVAMQKVTCIDSPTVEDAAEYCANKYGMSQCKTPLYAQCGDLVIIENENSVIAGLVHPNGMDVIAAGEDGWKAFPITSVKKAWHI